MNLLKSKAFTMIRSIFIIFFLAVFSVFHITQSQAEEQRLGHINTAQLLQEMPEVREAERDMRRYTQQLEKQLEALTGEFQRKLEEYQQQIETMSRTMRQDRERELTQLQQRVENFQMEAQKEIAEKEQELLDPILQKVESAISRVADQHGYSYIFDTSAGAVLHAPDSDNIRELVKTELGLN